MTKDLKAYGVAMLAYLMPSFVIAVVWHMMLFADFYDGLEIYRDQLLVPLGLLSMIIQAAVFALWFPRQVGKRSPFVEGLRFSAVAGILAWSYTVLPVAAKFPMTSISGFMLIETAFTVVQWAIAGTSISMAFARMAAD